MESENIFGEKSLQEAEEVLPEELGRESEENLLEEFQEGLKENLEKELVEDLQDGLEEEFQREERESLEKEFQEDLEGSLEEEFQREERESLKKEFPGDLEDNIGREFQREPGEDLEREFLDGLEGPLPEESEEKPEKDRDGFDEEEKEEWRYEYKAEAGWSFMGKRWGKPIKNCLFRPSDGLAVAFWIPVVIMVIIFIQREIFPFGEESFLRTDMYHQYAPFFSEFRHKLRTGGSLLYSWDVGMGVNFSALYAYYLASPLNWLLWLCPRELVIEFMTYSIVVKVGLSGMAFAWYLQRHCRSRDFGVGFFGIFYALSGYMAAYSWNIMWLDCIILFPIIMLGLEQLIRERKWKLYCISLGVSILSNYYISIMICLFMVLYFIALLILEGRKPFRDYVINCLEFAAGSLLAGGLAALVLLPEIYALKMTASGDFNFPKTFTSYFSIFDMLARHIGNVEVEIGLDHWPNIYCGVAVLMLFLLYLACRQIKVREKAVYCSLLFIFLASFSINVLNFIWHGFHFPNSLPCRQSFIYIAILLLICYRAYSHLDDMPWKFTAAAFWGAVIFVLMAEKLVKNSQFHFLVFYGAIIFLAMYTGLIYLWKQTKTGSNLILLLALGVVSIEAAVNTTVTSVTTTSRSSYIEDNRDVRSLTERIYPGDTFFRIEKVKRKTKNDGAWMNFPSVSLFSSTANADLTDLFKKLGCEASTNAYSITGSTPLVDALFSVKYGLYSEEQKDNPLLTLIGHTENIWLYENSYTLPLGFGVPFGFGEQWQLNLDNPAMVQNNLCALTGTDPVLEEYWGVEDNGAFHFTAEADGSYYVFVTNRKAEKIRVDWGTEAKTFDNVDRGYLLELGYMKAGDQVSLTSEDDKKHHLTAMVYRVSEKNLRELYECLNQHPWVMTKWSDTFLEGTIHLDEAGSLFTSIPYDKGWKVWVDGQKMAVTKIADTFLTVAIPAGEHKIEMKYEPQGLRTGAFITIGSVLVILALVTAERMIRHKNKRRDEK
ncbi:YfhO family protein [Lachnospiraceae bacterium 62-35]